VEEKFNSTFENLQKQLLKEQETRQTAEKEVAAAMLKSEAEIRMLRESLDKAQQQNDEAREKSKKYKESELKRKEKENKTKEEIRKLKEDLNRVRLESEHHRKMYENKCIIMGVIFRRENLKHGD
jgi:hypothetical protein